MYPMSLVGSLWGAEARPEPCNSRSNSNRPHFDLAPDLVLCHLLLQSNAV